MPFGLPWWMLEDEMTNDEKATLMTPVPDNDLRFEFTMSPTLGKLAAAMARAQAKMNPAFKEALNPHTGKYYASLASCTEALKPMHDEGLAVFQPPMIAPEGYVRCQTLVVHGESGEWLRGVLDMPIVAQTKKDGTKLPIDAQSYGSSLSYCRRYSLSSTVLLATSDDDAETTAIQTRQSGPSAGQATPSNGAPKPTPKPGPAKAATKPAPAPAPAPKQEPPTEETPEPEDLGPPPEEEPQQEPGAIMKVITAIAKANTPDLLIGFWNSRKNIDPSAHKAVWEALASRALELFPKAEAPDMKKYHELVVALDKPDALKRAYASRYAELKAGTSP